MKKNITMFAVLALAVFALSCGSSKESKKGITVTDAVGRTVTVPENPQRIIATGPGGLRMVYYLQAWDRVVGVEAFEHKNSKGRMYMYVFKKALELPVIGPGGPQSINKMPDTEAILKAKVQVIFAAHMKGDTAKKLQAKTGIPVVVVSYGPRFATLTSEFFTSLNTMATVLGKTDRAKAIKQFYDTTMADINKRVDDAEKAKVDKPLVYIGGIGFRGMQGLTSTDPMYLPLMYLKTNNLALKYSKKKHIFIDKEKLLSENPVMIFVDGLGLKLVRDEYQKNPDFYRELKAFKEGKVYLQLPFNFYTTNLGTALVDTYAAGKILYPDQFNDVSLKEKGDEIYSFLLGKALYDQVVKDFGDPEKPLSFK